MFDHVTIRASDQAASERSYATVLSTLGFERSYTGEDFAEWDDFSLAAAEDGKPATRRLHVAFVAPSRAHVDEFWRTSTRTGCRDDGPRDHARSTATTTTAPSSSIPTATTSSSSTTTAERC